MSDWKKLYESMAEAADALEKRCRALQSALDGLLVKERMWASERAQQGAIFQQMLNTKNAEHNEILEENRRLTRELEELRKGRG